jgi:Vta1 like
LLVAYWARVYSLQTGIKTAKQPDEKAFLLQIMDWLESVKKIQKDNESISKSATLNLMTNSINILNTLSFIRQRNGSTSVFRKLCSQAVFVC